MFDDIPKIEREKMLICVLIFYCVLTIAYCISLCFLHKHMAVNVFMFFVSSGLSYLIYRLVKYWKKNLKNGDK